MNLCRISGSNQSNKSTASPKEVLIGKSKVTDSKDSRYPDCPTEPVGVFSIDKNTTPFSGENKCKERGTQTEISVPLTRNISTIFAKAVLESQIIVLLPNESESPK